MKAKPKLLKDFKSTGPITQVGWNGNPGDDSPHLWFKFPPPSNLIVKVTTKQARFRIEVATND